MSQNDTIAAFCIGSGDLEPSVKLLVDFKRFTYHFETHRLFNMPLTKAQRSRAIELMKQGKITRDIAADIGCCIATIQDERMTDIPFDNECTRAQIMGFEIQADSLLTIAEENPDVNKARLQSDNLKWVLARRAAAKYGDKMTLDVNATLDIGDALKEAKSRVIPICYPTQQAQAQLPEIIDVSPHESTDNQSVSEPISVEIAPIIPEEDIFS